MNQQHLHRVHDPVLLSFIRTIKQEQASKTEDIVAKNYDSLYAVGRAQGTLDGLRLALTLLEQVMSDSVETDG